MCEDCGTVLCLGCLEIKTSPYYLCSKCHHNLGNPVPGERFEKCPECESENLSIGKRDENICPECHSKRTVMIEEKRRQLAHDMRHSIMGIHYGYTKLREVTNRLLSAKRLLVSLRMANFLHYRWLEDKIEECQKEINAVKSRVSNQAEIISKRMAAETKGIIDYNSWASSQFPFIEGVTNRITELCNQYRRNIDEALEPIRLILTDVDRQLEGLNYYRNEFRGFYEYAELLVNELPVCAFPDIRITGSDFLKNDKACGTLYITNRRLVFIAETGIVRKKTDVVFEYPLLYLQSLEEDGRLRKRLVLRMKQGFIKIACSEQAKNVIPDFIEISRKFDKYVQTDLQRVRRLEQNDVNVGDVRIKIDGLVHALLSVNARREEYKPYRSGPHMQDPFRSRQYQDDSYRRDRQPYRTDPPRKPYAAGSYPHGGETETSRLAVLRRNMVALENAIEETILLLKNRQLVTEDFIRRYRSLMKDSFETRKQLQGTDRRYEEYDW